MSSWCATRGNLARSPIVKKAALAGGPPGLTIGPSPRAHGFQVRPWRVQERSPTATAYSFMRLRRTMPSAGSRARPRHRVSNRVSAGSRQMRLACATASCRRTLRARDGATLSAEQESTRSVALDGPRRPIMARDGQPARLGRADHHHPIATAHGRERLESAAPHSAEFSLVRGSGPANRWCGARSHLGRMVGFGCRSDRGDCGSKRASSAKCSDSAIAGLDRIPRNVPSATAMPTVTDRDRPPFAIGRSWSAL
jgi:hypothetical protein